MLKDAMPDIILIAQKHLYHNYIRASKGFDRGFETGEAIRGMVAIYLELNLNAEDNLAIAA